MFDSVVGTVTVVIIVLRTIMVISGMCVILVYNRSEV
jgi:hypothetical protein